MTKDQSKAIKNMGEKCSVSCTIYRAEVMRADFINMKFEKYTTTTASRKPDLGVVELANIFKVAVPAVQGVNKVSGKVYISLEKALQYGVFVPDSEEEESEESEG